MKILIIDDDQLTSTTWSMGLKNAGFEVVNATNGQDGINQAKSQTPNLILLDQIMPDMLGNEVLSTLKQDPSTSNIPVMLISNYNENQMMKDAISQGAVDYILKYQIETKDLVDKVKTLLSQLGGTQPDTQAAPAATPATTDSTAPASDAGTTPAASADPTPGTPAASTDTPGDNNPTGSA
ncbi:MAG TPA: response regulator [Candidatus Saccharimonadales bacterium]|nr:response regulator [Candidatus Saccharimonadales bacterium]